MDIQKQKTLRWAYLAMSVVLLLCLGLIYAWSVFRAPLEAEFGWTKSQSSVTFSISMMMFCIGGLVSGVVTGKKGPRFTLTCCALCLAAGFAGASRINGLMGIYFFYGVLCGFGVGLGYNATISTIAKWFPDKQGLSSGFTLMGFGCGGMILGTLGASLITALGWRTTFLIFAIAFGVIILAIAMALRVPDEHFTAALAVGGKQTTSVEELPWTAMLRRKNFWIVFIWMIILSTAGLTIINDSTPLAAAIVGDDLALAATVAGVVSIFNGAGRVIYGALFDAKGYRVSMLGVCTTFIIGALLLMGVQKTQSLPLLVAAFVFIGMSYGGIPSTAFAFVAQFFGRENYPLNLSVTNTNLVVASFLAPLCASGGYMRTFTFILAFAIIGFVLILLVKRPAAKA